MRRSASIGDEASDGKAPKRVTSIAMVFRIRFAIVCVLIGTSALGGGASRADVLSLLYLRPIAVLCIGALLILPGEIEWRAIRWPLLLLSALAAVIAIQLLPLPPELWRSLPGRAPYAEGAAAAGMASSWRPMTLTPDLTWNSLLALIPPLAVLVGFAALRSDQRAILVTGVIGVACASALVGVLQITSGSNSPAYLYRIHHEGAAVGLFANRNHQSALLALTFPMLRAWTLMAPPESLRKRWRLIFASSIGLFLVPMILITGSRAGMALALGGIIAAFLLAPIDYSWRNLRRSWTAALAGLMLATTILLAFAAVLLGRAVAIERLIGINIMQEELRIQHTPLMLEIARSFLPFGSGFGSFDAVFRTFEPDDALDPSYFNHAHNDLLELAITGGLPALFILAVFVIWAVRRGLAAFFLHRATAPGALPARLGAIIIGMLLTASLVDYPLRTPLMSVVFALSCGWLAQRISYRDEIQHSTEAATSQQVDLPSESS